MATPGNVEGLVETTLMQLVGIVHAVPDNRAASVNQAPAGAVRWRSFSIAICKDCLVPMTGYRTVQNT